MNASSPGPMPPDNETAQTSEGSSAAYKEKHEDGRASRAQRLQCWGSRWKDLAGVASPIATTIGVILTIVALGLAIQQLHTANTQAKIANEQSRSNSATSVSTATLALDRDLVAQGRFRGCFIKEAGVPPCPVTGDALRGSVSPNTATPQSDDVTAIKGLALEHLDLFDALYNQSPYIAGLRSQGSIEKLDPGYSGDGWTAWSTYIVNTLQASDATCAVLDEHAEEYTLRFVADLGSYCRPEVVPH